MDYARWNMGPVFATIAREHHAKMLKKRPRLESIRKRVKHTEEEALWASYEESLIATEIDKSALITIVFAAIALEGYIYDYAARNFSDRFVRKFLDKLDTISKWVVIPQLVTGKEFPRDGQCFELLSGLVKERNRLVHYKSADIEFDRLEECSEQNQDWLIQSAQNAIEALDVIISQMSMIDPNEPVRMSLGGPNE